MYCRDTRIDKFPSKCTTGIFCFRISYFQRLSLKTTAFIFHVAISFWALALFFLVETVSE